jgi:hypothetical protein
MKYRKKPVVIEAKRLTKENVEEIYWFCHPNEKKPEPTRENLERLDSAYEYMAKNGMSIETLEGTIHASIGDYIIKGVQGEFYPCKPDIFEQTYEIITKDEAQQ